MFSSRLQLTITVNLNAIHEKSKNNQRLIDNWFHDQTILHLYLEDKKCAESLQQRISETPNCLNWQQWKQYLFLLLIVLNSGDAGHTFTSAHKHSLIPVLAYKDTPCWAPSTQSLWDPTRVDRSKEPSTNKLCQSARSHRTIQTIT